MNIFLDTDDRRLEQFLFAHRICFLRQYKCGDRNRWVYAVDSRLLRIVQEYMEMEVAE